MMKIQKFKSVIFLVWLASIILGIFAGTIPESEINLLNAHQSPIIEISDGKIIGINDVTDKGTQYSAFRGIPYAQPPIENLRFASPVKNNKWSDDEYWNGTQDANECVQGSGETLTGSEDCLYINVYAPKNAKNLAVLVWVHGGAFTTGGSSYDQYAPDFFLDDNVVFVSFNYRLGIFGFLSTEDTTVSGNWGLKDQVLALKWIKENVKNFGGDPNRITLFGESAGGASVSYLLQIPQAKSLFNAAILQSGNSLNLWALTTRARHAAFQVGYGLGIPALFARTLLDRLRGIDAYKLQDKAQSVSQKILALNPLRGLIWAPIIEAESSDAVFTKKSDEFLQSGQFPSKVPVMLGFTSNEAGHAHGLSEELRSLLFIMDAGSGQFAPYSLASNLASSTDAKVSTNVRSNFFSSEALSAQFNKVVKFLNVDQFTRGVLRTANNIVPHVPAVYFYIFGYIGEITGENPYDGAGHAEDLFYLFKQPLQYSRNDLVVRDKLVRLWTNFAKNFNPTPERDPLLDNLIWPKVTEGNHLDFVWLNYTISKDVNPVQKDYDYYKDLFKSHGAGSYSTY